MRKQESFTYKINSSLTWVFNQIIYCFYFCHYTDGAWTEEASNALVELTQFRTLQAQVAGYTEAGLPEIYLYSYLGPSVSMSKMSSNITISISYMH